MPLPDYLLSQLEEKAARAVMWTDEWAVTPLRHRGDMLTLTMPARCPRISPATGAGDALGDYITAASPHVILSLIGEIRAARDAGKNINHEEGR